LPVFANLEYRFRNAGFSPSLFLKAGYCFPVEDSRTVVYNEVVPPYWSSSSIWPNPYYDEKLKAKGGVLINPGFGMVNMFLGTQNGMLVYSLEVPTLPDYIGQFWHVTSCDPVVVSNGYAYITLRSGNNCGGTVNRLDVLELSENYNNNKLLASYPMVNPHGLGIDDPVLFICDGSAGLKVYDASDKLHIDDHMITSFPGIHAFDVIPSLLILINFQNSGPVVLPGLLFRIT